MYINITFHLNFDVTFNMFLPHRYGFVYFSEDVDIQTIVDVRRSLLPFTLLPDF